MTTRVLLAALLAFSALPVLAQQPAKCQLVKIAEWPIKIINNHPILEGTINGKKVGVLLDTGAYASSMTKASADKLDVPTRPTNEIASGFGGSSRVFLTTLEEVKLGEAVRKNWRVRVVGERPIPNVDFILGDDFFKLVDLEFDYAKGVVRVFQPENCKTSFLGYWDPNAQVVERENEDKIVVPIKLNGRSGRAMLDSGASTSIVALSFAEDVGIRKDSPGVMAASCSGGIGGAVNRNWVARFDSVSIGNEVIRDAQLRVQDYTTDMGGGRRTPPDMFLGTDFLKSHRVYVARSQDKVYFSYTGGVVFPAMPSLECDERTAGKSPAEALAAYNQAIAANPNDTKALMQRASLRRQANEISGAISDLDTVIQIEPRNGVALAMRSSLRAQVKDIDGSLADSEAAIAVGQRSAPMYASRGAMFRSKGNCERAIVEFEEALKIDPNLQSAQRGRDACRKGEAKSE